VDSEKGHIGNDAIKKIWLRPLNQTNSLLRASINYSRLFLVLRELWCLWTSERIIIPHASQSPHRQQADSWNGHAHFEKAVRCSRRVFSLYNSLANATIVHLNATYGLHCVVCKPPVTLPIFGHGEENWMQNYLLVSVKILRCTIRPDWSMLFSNFWQFLFRNAHWNEREKKEVARSDFAYNNVSIANR
jgi:hypothetical protein